MRGTPARLAASELREAVAKRLETLLRECLADSGRASLVLSGGRTPGPVLECLDQADISWRLVTLLLSDERWAPPNDPDSNEGLIRRSMPRALAQGARLMGLWSPEAVGAEVGASLADSRLARIPRPFDIALLGMGTDGHFASLFPGQTMEDRAGRSCISAQAPAHPQERISLSYNEIKDISHILLLANGAEKEAVLERARAGDPTLPLSCLLRDRPDISVFLGS